MHLICSLEATQALVFYVVYMRDIMASLLVAVAEWRLAFFRFDIIYDKELDAAGYPFKHDHVRRFARET